MDPQRWQRLNGTPLGQRFEAKSLALGLWKARDGSVNGRIARNSTANAAVAQKGARLCPNLATNQPKAGIEMKPRMLQFASGTNWLCFGRCNQFETGNMKQKACKQKMPMKRPQKPAAACKKLNMASSWSTSRPSLPASCSSSCFHRSSAAIHPIKHRFRPS